MSSTPTFIIPGLFWLHSADNEYLSSQLKLPNIDKLLNNCTVEIIPNKSLSYWLYDLPSATISAQQTLSVQGFTEFSNWLYVEPTHLRVDRDRLLISEPELLQLNDQETINTIETINNHFENELKIFKLNDNLWLIGCNIDTSEIFANPIIDIIGENIDEYLPTGKNSLKLHSVMNEIQMLLFNNDVNTSRENDGLLAINSVWFWQKEFDNKTNLITCNDLTNITLRESIQSAVTNGSYIYLDTLLYSAKYRDSFAWVNNLNKLDNLIGNELLQTLDKYKSVQIIIPSIEQSIKLIIKKSNLLNLFKQKNYHKLTNEIAKISSE